MTLVKEVVRQALFRGTIMIDVRATGMGFCNRGERLCSTRNTIRKSGTLYPSGRVGVWGQKIIKRQHQR